MPASVAGKFFKFCDGSIGLGVMLGPGRELAVAHCVHLAAQCLHRNRDAEFLPQPLPEIAQPPADNALRRRDRAMIDLRRKRLAVCISEQRFGA